MTLEDALLRETVVQRLKRVRPDSSARWGRMSAPQMICHLSDSFRACIGEKAVSMATGLPQRTVMKWFALYVPLPWPKGISTRPEIDQASGSGTPPSVFEKDCEDLIRLTQRFCDPKRDVSSDRHPFFGAMKRKEWLRWAYLHMDHHLRQFGV